MLKKQVCQTPLQAWAQERVFIGTALRLLQITIIMSERRLGEATLHLHSTLLYGWGDSDLKEVTSPGSHTKPFRVQLTYFALLFYACCIFLTAGPGICYHCSGRETQPFFSGQEPERREGGQNVASICRLLSAPSLSPFSDDLSHAFFLLLGHV